jgi:hypothetical protein
MLCDQCSILAAAWLVPRTYDIKEGKETVPEHWWTHGSWLELKEAAQICELCNLIYEESFVDESGPYKKTDKPGIRFELSGARAEIWCTEVKRKTRLNIGFDLSLSFLDFV